MSRTLRILVCMCFVAGAMGALWAKDAVGVKREAQNKLLARRAGRMDAIRKLTERIKGLQITSETTVRDFVTENDEINAVTMAFIRGMREKKVTHMEDGTCQIVIEVTLREVIVNLKGSYKRYYKGDKVKIEDFQKMLITYKDKIITVTGNGAPRSEEWETAGLEMIPVVGEKAVGSIDMPVPAKAFWFKYCTGRGRLMAVRAAQVDAQRRLAERIKGIYITSETTVRDFVTESDEIKAVTEAALRGARETGICYHTDELIVEVEMTIKLRTVYASLKSWMERHHKDDKVKIKQLEQLTLTAKDTTISETGMGVPPKSYLKKDIPAAVAAVAAMAGKAPEWISQKLREVGNGAIDKEATNPVSAKLMAMRAAELDARRKLAEQIEGLMITSKTSIRDFVALHDDISTAMVTYQQGARVVPNSEKMLEDGTTQVMVEINLHPLWDMVIFYQRKLKVVIK